MKRLLAACVLASACATTGVVNTALHGDLLTLKNRIREGQQRGELDAGVVRDLARAVAGRELRSAKGDRAVLAVHEVRACVGPLVPVLRDRAAGTDDAGAEATLVLLEARLVDPAPLLADYREASSGAWRAVAARAASTRAAGELRRKLMVDPDQRVRLAALDASIHAEDPADLPDALEAARLDPSPLCRSVATRAAGAIGGEKAVLGLVDQWQRADGPTRVTIIDGWAMPAAWKAGGEREILRVVETSSGLPALAAASALIRMKSSSAATGHAEIAQAIVEGAHEERITAIRLSRLGDPGVDAALTKAEKGDDTDVQVLALARRLGDPKTHDAAVTKLRKLAEGKGRAAIRAQAALAVAGDPSVEDDLIRNLGSKSALTRVEGALGLIRLGRLSAAATALADDDPGVRTRVACRMLATTH